MSKAGPPHITLQKWIAIGAAVLLFCILYFGFSLVDKKKKKEMDKVRSLTTEATSPEALLKEAKANISHDTLELTDRLEHFSKEGDTIAMTDNLKRLSGIWYSQKRYGLAGYYAQKVAEIEDTPQAWSITGTSFATGVKTLAEGPERDFCISRAIKAFEHAISLEPSVTAHRINLASIYVDAPPKDQPMKGIQMLLELNKNEPDNTSVLNLLGQLAIKTGQYDKAVKRLEKSLEINPDNPQTPCLLSMAYEGTGQHEKAHAMAEKCRH
ncbi:MAG: tetratricopeptide repeat protein [Saprospiraceae bacterium]|nr:tetratricopeptide repeat protein [Saprospiraceae bacterium]